MWETTSASIKRRRVQYGILLRILPILMMMMLHFWITAVMCDSQVRWASIVTPNTLTLCEAETNESPNDRRILVSMFFALGPDENHFSFSRVNLKPVLNKPFVRAESVKPELILNKAERTSPAQQNVFPLQNAISIQNKKTQCSPALDTPVRNTTSGHI